MTDLGARSLKRDTYRHGDLRCALLNVGVELAKAGGPDRRRVARSDRQSRASTA
jgi:hypothetical protein